MKLIAKILAFYFFLGSIFPNTDFSQLAKVFNLCEHFVEHKQENKTDDGFTISVVSFLADHYSQCETHRHSSGNDHQNLPLQQLNPSADFVFNKIPLTKNIELHNSGSKIHFTNNQFSRDYHQSIFQPPVV